MFPYFLIWILAMGLIVGLALYLATLIPDATTARIVRVVIIVVVCIYLIYLLAGWAGAPPSPLWHK